jgi:hypothetical protein
MKNFLLPLLATIMLTFVWSATTAWGATKRDGALFAEPRLDSAPFNQATRLTGNPDSALRHPYRFTEPTYLTGMSTRLLAKNGTAPAGGAAKAPAAPGGAGGSEQASLAEVGAKLSNPVSDVWGLFTQFTVTRSDGDLNTGESPVSGNIIFQPILPIPLYGKGTDTYRMIVRPTIPFLMGSPVPTGFDNFDNKTGLGDILLPLPVTIPAGNWILAAGPAITLPTSTIDAFGRQQWAVGPTGVLGYKTKKLVAVVFPQYYWGIGSRGDQKDKPDASYMSMLYAFFYNLPEAWQFGFNPTVSYDNKALSGNRWNVPVGLVVAKTTPVKFQFGMEYSVVSQDAFGPRWSFKLNIIPVIQSLVPESLFGGE